MHDLGRWKAHVRVISHVQAYLGRHAPGGSVVVNDALHT